MIVLRSLCSIFCFLMITTTPVLAGMLSARVGHTATPLPGGKILIVGGDCKSGHSTAELYDPKTKQSESIGETQACRSEHTATLLNNGKVLILGGSEVVKNLRLQGELYDPSSKKFELVPVGTSVRRYGHAATALKDGRVLITGGMGIPKNGMNSRYKEAELYNPDTNTFSTLPLMGSARSSHASVLLPDGRVLIAGYDHEAEIFDPAQMKFVSLPTKMLQSRYAGLSATLLKNGKVLIVGGDTVYTPRDAEIFDPQTNTFATTGALNEFRRSFHGATLLQDGRVLISGGFFNYSVFTSEKSGISSKLEIYDPATGKFSLLRSLPTERYGHQAIQTDDGKVLIFGGVSWNKILSDIIEITL